MSEKLKPCPFCGGDARLLDGLGEYWVFCVCRSSGPLCSSKDEAIRKWNTRHTEQGAEASHD